MTTIAKDYGILIDPDACEGLGRGIIFAPARDITAETVNEMARAGRGLIACCVSPRRAFELGLQVMRNTTHRPGTPNYLVSVEAACCTDTGISAADRALTLRTVGDPAATPADLCAPGHIMPCVLPTTDEGNGAILKTAFHLIGARAEFDAIAWCDILDDQGELASSRYCRNLALKLRCAHYSALSGGTEGLAA